MPIFDIAYIRFSHLPENRLINALEAASYLWSTNEKEPKWKRKKGKELFEGFELNEKQTNLKRLEDKTLMV